MSAVFATFDSAKKRSAIVLSGGDLIATSNDTPANWSLVCINQSKTSGKWYMEATLSGSGTACGFGVCQPSTDVTTGNQTITQTTPPGLQSAATMTLTHVYGLALDADGKTLKSYDNNVLQETLDISSLGTDFLIIFLIQTSIETWTINCGASAFTYTPPSGYQAGVFTGTLDTASLVSTPLLLMGVGV